MLKLSCSYLKNKLQTLFKLRKKLIKNCMRLLKFKLYYLDYFPLVQGYFVHPNIDHIVNHV